MCSTGRRRPDAFTTLNVYVAGYGNDDVASVPVGYGTLIPDPSSPISGILHESDVHGTPRAPAGHRLFRIMSPTPQTGSHETVKAALTKHLGTAEPVVFEHIGSAFHSILSAWLYGVVVFRIQRTSPEQVGVSAACP